MGWGGERGGGERDQPPSKVFSGGGGAALACDRKLDLVPLCLSYSPARDRFHPIDMAICAICAAHMRMPKREVCACAPGSSVKR